MNGPDVYRVLKGKNINQLHHANTVTTSCSLLQRGGLASRGYINDLGLPQTHQYTDPIDQKFGIWNDVFVDTVDIHARTKGLNNYGPVLFVLDPRVLNTLPPQSEVSVTKKNPTKWVDNEPEDARWFLSPDELESGLEKGDFGQMIVIRTLSGILPFPSGVLSIVVDDPQIPLSNGTPAFEHATNRLNTAAQEGGIDVMVSKRPHLSSCKCLENYRTPANLNQIKHFFE